MNYHEVNTIVADWGICLFPVETNVAILRELLSSRGIRYELHPVTAELANW